MDIENKTDIDFNLGGVLGVKVTDRLGIFIEGKYQRYWDIENYKMTTGINYSIF
jgi:hypothetical protein